MIYVLTATKAEAQAFVDKYKLKNYKNENLTLIITGIGMQKTNKAIQNLKTKLTKKDIILNVGICAAPKEIKISSLYKISKVKYQDKTITLFEGDTLLESVEFDLSEEKKHLVDMEAFVIAKELNKYNLHIYKIVSDNFEPNTITKDFAKMLVFQNIKNIKELP